MIPTFLIVQHLGLVDSLGALIAPNLVTPFGIFLLRQFFRTLPIELEEAARIDGCSRLGRALPDRAAAVDAGARDARDRHVPVDVERLPVAADRHHVDDQSTVQLGLASFQGAHQTNWTLLMAGNVMALAPMLIVFIVAQRWFVRSIASTGVKG